MSVSGGAYHLALLSGRGWQWMGIGTGSCFNDRTVESRQRGNEKEIDFVSEDSSGAQIGHSVVASILTRSRSSSSTSRSSTASATADAATWSRSSPAARWTWSRGFPRCRPRWAILRPGCRHLRRRPRRHRSHCHSHCCHYCWRHFAVRMQSCRAIDSHWAAPKRCRTCRYLQ